MRGLVSLTVFLISTVASAQQCPQCSAADACMREYTHSTIKLKADYVMNIAAQRKGAEQTLPPATRADQGNLSVQQEIDKLRDCLGKIH